ncbi:hypothetical protein DdX_20012 [Ditylenchus destructor]|uniref:Uncharacterized protein n=1 Tax=Ditylenchus destructor TaxID=166010 RepID=A0AAD4QWM1_9BILA|nr:hypothetical protein DdX_20012 [Ditylenchus destructor]
MTSPLLDQYQLEDVVQFIALKQEPGLRTKLQLVNRHIQLFVRKLMSKRTHCFETAYLGKNWDMNPTCANRKIMICNRLPRMTITEIFNQITDGTLSPPPEYFRYGVVKIAVQDLCPELEAILRAFKSAFRGCDLWINYGFHSHDGNFPPPFRAQSQLISKLREMFEIFTDVTAIRLFGYNLSNFSNPFAPEDDANNFMDLPEFMKVSSLDIHLRKSLGANRPVPFDASRPQISEEDICLWLHANPNSGLVPRKMDIVIFYLNPAFIVKLVKMVSEIFSASTNFCPFDLTLKRRRYLDQDILDRKGIAAGLTQLFSSLSPEIFSYSIIAHRLSRFPYRTISEIHQFTQKNKTTNETLVVEICSQNLTISRHT